jgi:hypothetical protein
VSPRSPARGELVADEDLAAEELRDRLRGLLGTGERARDDDTRRVVQLRELLAEQLRAVTTRRRQLTQLVGLAGERLGVATEVDAHSSPRIVAVEI